MALKGPSRAELRQAVVAALAGAGTLAGASVFDSRFKPLVVSNYPAVLVSTPAEAKEAAAASLQGAPTFDTDVTLALSLRTSSTAPAGTAPAQAQVDLEQLEQQVLEALLCGPALLGLVQGIRSVHTQFTVAADGATVTGEASVILVVTVRQQYWPDGGVPLTGITVNPAGSVAAPLFTVPIAQPAPAAGS